MSYSQFGEDLIIAHLLFIKGITKPSYLDIGANEPKQISNTYYFYTRGSRGVLVEPNPYLYRKLKRQRPHDIVLNKGVAFDERTEAEFYLFAGEGNGLSTFSEKEAMHWHEVGVKGAKKYFYEKVITIPLIGVNKLLEDYFSSAGPDILSIDVEGFDLQILQSLDFNRYAPKIICVETLKYNSEGDGYKYNEIIDFLEKNNYLVFADTWVNTIFYKK
jgi:FkbM family methyltransferase